MKAKAQLSRALSKPGRAPIVANDPGFTLHKLRKDDYHEICGLSERVRGFLPDDSGPMVGHMVITPDGKSGMVTGYAIDLDTEKRTEFVRVNGRLYHPSVLRLV